MNKNCVKPWKSQIEQFVKIFKNLISIFLFTKKFFKKSKLLLPILLLKKLLIVNHDGLTNRKVSYNNS